ncbi:2-(1,2-epoxy-1,2-dihydrophenyl)acetyl-CoA isomerase PaaG [Oceanibaculum indicum]|uniref:Enoyl-CoA hydratase n=1 Tax=Oceanibaculum indicum P24 TaxID=1207063 RepID=K2J3R0_9PROT|nr:2-(1,2-epoxy-1,2-dihydrophenyl)acetyl-CoA isomerase PaaG [Oceanibaculum indicum]EKE69527.1 enoyl-CoA hydratase [Oceanibaculum indicum P24]
MAAYETLLVDVADGVMTITLNRPDKLNAFTTVMLAEMTVALDAAEKEEAVRAILITGSGRGFCAGQDLGDRKVISDDIDLGASLEERYNPLVKRLRALPKPVVCAVNGVAAGAGANFALCCDIVLAAESASFIQAFARIGLVPDCGGTWLLPRLVGHARAMALALTAEKLEAARAAEWGLIWKVLPDAELMPEAVKLARHLATQPTRALGLIKQAIQASTGHSLDGQLDMERDLQREAGRTADYREGVAAFLAKRPPAFQGK